jgi:hypothetical protein
MARHGTRSTQGDDTPSVSLQRVDSMSPEAKVSDSQSSVMSLDETDEAKAEPEPKPNSSGPRFPSFVDWKKKNATHTAQGQELEYRFATSGVKRSTKHSVQALYKRCARRAHQQDCPCKR